MSFNQGIFPNILKIANVISIHENGDKFDCNNYRSISLLSNISKIYEKSMHISLLKIFLGNISSYFVISLLPKWILDNHALTSLTGMIRKALDEYKTTETLRQFRPQNPTLKALPLWCKKCSTSVVLKLSNWQATVFNN